MYKVGNGVYVFEIFGFPKKCAHNAQMKKCCSEAKGIKSQKSMPRKRYLNQTSPEPLSLIILGEQTKDGQKSP